MNDPAKYIKLFWMLILSFIAFIVVFILIFLGIRLVFGLVNQIPWITYLYSLFILSVPPAIFITGFTIFLSRTRSHPSKPARIVSYIMLGAFLLGAIVFYVMDIIAFFRTAHPEVLEYNSWNLIFIVGCVACLFIVGIIQALASTKEEDWLERHKRQNP